MSKKALNGVFERIRKLAAVQTGQRSSDPELLARFIGAADEAAFTVLVERHGPMVLGLCRRLLHHADDADDACQATFLVLARKAKSLRRRSALGAWLHGVAYRIAGNLRRQRARQRRREQDAPPRSVEQKADDITWGELRGVLDEELQRLPERYRAPLILCYLSGKTRDEAAQELGQSPGRLHGLLERGRKILRERLTQRGLTLSAALLATALPAGACKAALPAALVVASTKAALAAAGTSVVRGAIAPRILSLAQEAQKTMFVTKLQLATALILGCGILTGLVTGGGGTVGLAQDAKQPTAVRFVTAAVKVESDEEFIRRVSKDLRDCAPTPAEIHFFLANKDPGRRQKLIDLFIQERQAKQKADSDAKIVASAKANYREAVVLRLTALRKPRVSTIQSDYYKAVLEATKEKKEVAAITQTYLDRLLKYVGDHPKAGDVPDAMLQISLVYRSQNKRVEADAWRDKLRKEHPDSPAAKTSLDETRRGSTVNVLLRELPEMEARVLAVEDEFSLLPGDILDYRQPKAATPPTKAP